MNWTAIKGTFQCIALIAVSYLSVTAAIAVHTFEKHISAVTMQVGDTVTKVNTALDHINKKKTGTLDQADSAINDVRLLVAHSDRTLTAQQMFIGAADANVTALLHNINGLVLNASSDENTLASQASLTMVAAQNDLIQLQRDEVTANDSIADFQKQMDLLSPAIIETTQHADVTMDNVQAATTDIRNKIHDELHPSKKKLGFWGTFGAGLIAFKKYDPLPSPTLF